MAKANPRRDDISAEFLRSILDYDQETGVFTWKARKDYPKAWNTRFVGKPTGCKCYHPKSMGTVAGKPSMIQIRINDILYLANRLAWLYVTGEWPQEFIDHADHNPFNNAFDNLRPATHSENLANRPVQVNSQTGHKGIQQRTEGCWRVRVNLNKKNLHCSHHSTLEDAIAARDAALAEHHGAFARA